VFNQNAPFDTRVAVLEEKFSVYEQMMNKLEAAIRTISETSQGISKMLAIHDERLENTIRSDTLILQKITEVDARNAIEHEKVITRMNELEDKVDEISKIKWMTIGTGVVLAVLATAFSTLASGWWTPPEMQMLKDGHMHQQNVPPDKN